MSATIPIIRLKSAELLLNITPNPSDGVPYSAEFMPMDSSGNAETRPTKMKLMVNCGIPRRWDRCATRLIAASALFTKSAKPSTITTSQAKMSSMASQARHAYY